MQLLNGRIVIPHLLGPAIVQALYTATHLGQEKTGKLLRRYFYILFLATLAKGVSLPPEQCLTGTLDVTR